MKVLYLTTTRAPGARAVLKDLIALDPSLDLHSVVGAAGALNEIRRTGEYGALFVAPSVSQDESLALISSLRRDRTPLAIVAIVTEADRHFFADALTAGADDVLVLKGQHLVAVEDTLRRVRQNRHIAPDAGQPRLRVLYVGQDEQTWNLLAETPFVEASRAAAHDDGSMDTAMSAGERPDVCVVDEQPRNAHALQVVKWLTAHRCATSVIVLITPTGVEIGSAALELGADEVVTKTKTYRRRLVASLHRIFLRRPAAETGPAAAAGRLAGLTKELQSSAIALTALRAQYDQLLESQAFERALRDRDRDELAAVTRELNEERERRAVLEDTLRQSETTAQAERGRLQEEVAKAADRLHQVAHTTQLLQARLERQIAERVAGRDRLTETSLIGHAVLSKGGRLLQCNPAFAALLGYSTPAEAVDVRSGSAFPGVPDHHRVLELLESSGSVDRLESTLRRVDGRAVRVLTSATLLGSGEREGIDPVVERLVVDLSDLARAETELRLARRLEAAGRLAAEMAPEIETALDNASTEPAAQRRALLLVRQLMAFSRNQAKPAGLLSLNDAIHRSESLLRQITGDTIDLRIVKRDVEPVAAGEEDIERLLVEVVTAAAACLPFGGQLTIETSLEPHSTFVLRTTLTATAAGYGVIPCTASSSLVRFAALCGGSVRTSDTAGRTSTLHVHLP